MNKKLLLFTLLLFTALSFSQKVEVKGKVLDANTELPLAGVNITIKNASQSASSDIDGNFKISNIITGTKLIFSYVGYSTNEVTVINDKMLTIRLQEDKKSLEEVVVVGYGTVKKKDITGSVSLVSSKTIEDLRPVKVEQALQGTVAGVNVISNSGSPGSEFTINIRGIGTNRDNGPLVVIDGYIINDNNKSDIGLLNPSDIESMTVLKDAQAAIYGRSGANGVILITTKMGKRNSKTRISFNSSTGMQETTNKISLLNAKEYALLLNESYANGGQTIPYPNVSNLSTGTNWQNEVFQKAPIFSNDFSFTGGSEKMGFAVSASDLKQSGIIGLDKSSFKRNTARIGLNADITNKLTLQTNFIYTYVNRKTLSENGLGSVLFNAINTPATLPVYDSQGNYTLVPSTTGFGNEVINPLAQIDNTYNDYSLRKLNGVFKLEYGLFKKLKVTSTMGFNSSTGNSKSFFKEVNYGNKVFNVAKSNVNQNKVNDNDYTFDLYGTYDTTFYEKHKIKFTLGTEARKKFGSGLFGTGYNIPYNSWDYADISLATETGGVGVKDANSYEYSIPSGLSYFLRLEYDFKSKYLFSFLGRRDLSASFGSNFRVAYFPSFTAGWVVSKEDFFKENKYLNLLKIRGSYGLLGSDKIGDYGYIGNLDGEGVYVLDGNIVHGTAVGVLANPSIKWEADTKTDIGMDIQLFKSKIDITTDYFKDVRNDLLIERLPVSGITGVAAPGSGAPTVNAGTVKNSGLEFAINYKEKISDNFNFKLAYNITKIKNVVTEVKNNTHYQENGSFGITSPKIARMEEGHAMGYFYGFQTDGIFQNQAEIDAHPSQVALGSVTAPGDIRYKDINGDGVITEKDKTDLGNPIPKFTMGFNLNLTYKNLDFMVYSFASIGNKAVRNYERVLSDVNKLNYQLNRWTGEGTSNTVPRVTTGATNNYVFSDYYVEDASFLRIQNVQLGYTLNPKYSQIAGINKLRIYTSVNNLYTFTKYRGFDPTASDGRAIGGGIDNGFYPAARTYTLGLSVNF
jgi:TonB-dependent starch-binding outer membrane protein SusC